MKSKSNNEQNKSFVDLLTIDPFKYSYDVKVIRQSKTPIRLKNYLSSNDNNI